MFFFVASNDEPPLFLNEPEPFRTSLNPLSTPPSQIFIALARDPDGSPVGFSLGQVSPQTPVQLFQIEARMNERMNRYEGVVSFIKTKVCL